MPPITAEDLNTLSKSNITPAIYPSPQKNTKTPKTDEHNVPRMNLEQNKANLISQTTRKDEVPLKFESKKLLPSIPEEQKSSIRSIENSRKSAVPDHLHHEKTALNPAPTPLPH